MFLKDAHQGCVYLMKNTVKREIFIFNLKCKNNLKELFLMFCLAINNYLLTVCFEMGFNLVIKASLLQSSVSHDPSEKKNMLLNLINVFTVNCDQFNAS